VDEHLAGKLFSNVEYPYPPWAFWRFSLSLVDERKDDEETQQSLNRLDRFINRSRQGGGDGLYAQEQLDLGDGKSACRRRGSHRGPHPRGMRVVAETALTLRSPIRHISPSLPRCQ
jgi:hypothetical protein